MTRVSYRRRRTASKALSLVISSVVALLSACDGTRLPAGPARGPLSANILTGDALAALTSDGRFQRRDVLAGSPVAALSRQQAEAMAAGYWKTFGRTMRSEVASRHGAPIEPDRLTPCGTSVIAEGPYEPPTPLELSSVRAFLGPQWVVPFCDGNEAQLIVTVSALAAGLIPRGNMMASPEFVNTTFSFQGIPVGTQLVLAPEDAALAVARATGARVTTVPRLLRADPPWSRWWSMWAVDVDRATNVLGAKSGRTRSLSTVIYGHIPTDRWRAELADNAQQAPVDSVRDISTSLLGGGPVTARLRRRQGPVLSSIEAVQVRGGATP